MAQVTSVEVSPSPTPSSSIANSDEGSAEDGAIDLESSSNNRNEERENGAGAQDDIEQGRGGTARKQRKHRKKNRRNKKEKAISLSNGGENGVTNSSNASVLLGGPARQPPQGTTPEQFARKLDQRRYQRQGASAREATFAANNRECLVEVVYVEPANRAGYVFDHSDRSIAAQLDDVVAHFKKLKGLNCELNEPEVYPAFPGAKPGVAFHMNNDQPPVILLTPKRGNPQLEELTHLRANELLRSSELPPADKKGTRHEKSDH